MKNAIIAVLATLVTVVSQGQNLAREQVVKGGNTPYHRYDVPEGKLDVAPLSIFTQPPYEKNKKVVDAMPRGRAEDLGFTGELVYNEYPDRAPKVKLAATSVLIYEETPQGKVPRYLADCQRNGKPYANRIALVDTSRFQAKPQTREVFQTQPTNVTVNNPPTTNTVNMPAIPGTFNVNVAGLPQYPQPATYPAYPTNITYHVINESIVHRDWAAKFKDVGIGGGVLLAGAAAETGSILIPRAITKSAQIKADASKDVANIQAAAAKYTAEQQVLAAGALKPATYTISATAPATMNGGVQTLSPQITTTTTSTANPKVDVSPTIAPTVSTVATAAPVQNGAPVTATIAPGAVNVAANSYGSTNNVNANGTGGSVAPITVSPTIAPVVSANGGNVAPISVVATGGKSDSNTGPISTTVVNKPNVDVSSSSISASSAEAAANAAAKTVTPVSIGVLPPDFKPIPDHSFPPPCDYITSDGGDQ